MFPLAVPRVLAVYAGEQFSRNIVGYCVYNFVDLSILINICPRKLEVVVFIDLTIFPY